jgi:hypothetical protein
LRETAEGHGYRSPLGAGTRAGSPARLVAAVREGTPFGDVFSSQVKADNQALTATKLADALGLPKPEKITSIDPTYHLAEAEAQSGLLFEQVQAELPGIGSGNLARALEGVKQKAGAFGKLEGQKIVNEAVEKLKASDTIFDGEQIMNDRQWLSSKMADFYAKGDTHNGELLRDALSRMDDAIEKVTKKRGNAATVEKWQRARSQWQLLTMAKQPGVISATGDVNPVSMLRKMVKDKANGGFGRDGPARGTKARVLWDIVRVAAGDETHVPMTGYRGLIANQMKGTVGKGLLFGGAASAVGGAAHGLLD